MKRFFKAAVILVMSIVTIGCIDTGVSAAMKKEVLSSKTTLPEDGQFNVIAEPFDWGKDVTRIMLKPGGIVKSAELKAEDFNVTGKHYSEQAYKDDTNGPRKVLDAYAVDAQGNKVDEGEYIILNLEYGKDVSGAHMGSYSYASYYTPLTVTYTVAWNNTSDKYKQHEVVNLLCDEYELERYTDSSIIDSNYNYVDYAFYKPETDTSKHPLIIFFHGMGEGGAGSLNNHGVQMYAYPECNFANEEIQGIMGNAYVLLPQSPDRWPTDGFTNESKYLDVVNNLIDSIISNNPDIDTNRIYVGGLSMGGFMASRVILNRPEKYAAAFPCSQAYRFTAEDAQKLKSMPIWVSCCETDGTCSMDGYTFASYKELVNGGCNKAVCCVMESNEKDPTSRMRFYSGDTEQYERYYGEQENVNTKTGQFVWDNNVYGGHDGGWVAVFANGEYYNDEAGNKVTIMQWLAAQSLVDKLDIDDSKVKKTYNAGEVFSAANLVVTAVYRDGKKETVTDYTVSSVDTSKAGTVKVTVEYAGCKGTFDIVVNSVSNGSTEKPLPTPACTNSPVINKPVVTTSVVLSETTAILCKKGANKLILNATVSGSTGNVVWSSSASKIASVNENGVVRAKAAGKATITATVNGVTAKCSILVKNATFKLAKTKYTLKKGKSQKVKVTLSSGGKAKFISANKKMAKVNNKGVIKGLKKGKTTVTVKAFGITQIISVTVK